MTNINATARKLKITTILEGAEFVRLGVPPDNAPSRTTLTVTVGGRTLTADLATKAIRKAVKTLQESGQENVVLLLQGALVAGDRVEEAGLTAQVKTKAEGTT
jgi:hypothetical protein